jgi:formate hydrogenlyase subunit 4
MNLPILALNVALAIAIAPLLDGLRRKITARLQNRVGPPLMQSWHDIIKLLRKETVLPEGAGLMFRVLPALMLMLSLAMFAMIATVTVQSPMDEGGIIFIELAVLSAFMFAIAGGMSGNPYGVVGGSREAILATLVEPSIIASLTALLLFKGSLTLDDASRSLAFGGALVVAAVAYLLSLLAESGRVPFDVAEAESELTGGYLIEFSGPPLAMLKLGQFIRATAMYSVPKLFLTALIPVGVTGDAFSVAVAALYMVSILLCTLLVSMAESLNARYRLLEASKFYAAVLIFSLLALMIAFYAPGWR